MTRLAKATAIIAATLLGVAALWELSGPVLVLLISLVVAAAARAPVDHLISLGVPKLPSLGGIYLLGLVTLAGVMLAAIYLVSGELGRAADDFQRLYQCVANHSSSVPWLEHNLKERLPPARELLTAVVGNHGEQAFRLVLGTAFGLVGSLIDFVFVIVLSIYWTIDREYFERLWLSLLPLPHRVSARTLWRMLEAELGAYARSEIAQSLLAGIVLWAGFHALGLRYPALLALVAALSWLVPWLGVIIALFALAVGELPHLILDWPASLLSLPAAALFTVAVFLLLEVVVEPRLFKRRRYNSLFIVLAVMALAETFGILGLLLGPMLAVTIQAAVEHMEREQVAARMPAADFDALEDRIASARALAASADELPREWTSILNRLDVLVSQARLAFDESE
jgi:putative permease